LTAYVLLGIVCGSLILSAASSFNFSPLMLQYEPPAFNRFRSEAEMTWYLQEKAKAAEQNGYPIVSGISFAITPGVLTQANSAASAATVAAVTKLDEATDYSATNIQVAGVDEADLVKTDGNYIYLSKGSTVYIVKAYPAEDAAIVAQIPFASEVDDLYIVGDSMVVFTAAGHGQGMTRPEMIWGNKPIWIGVGSAVDVYDVSNRSSPILKRTYESDGDYVSSRLIGDYVYVVFQKGACVDDNCLNLPEYRENDTVCVVPATSIYYYNGTDPSYTYTSVVSIDAKDPKAPVESKTFLLGSTSAVYCSAEYLYLTTAGASETEIHKMRLDGGTIEGVADGSVPGWVLSQYSMDESNGYLRVATTTGHAWGGGSSKNNIYVLDPGMKVAGKLEDLAPGEQIYSARFMGDRLYLVTFKKIDPFFVVDLSDPSAPRVLGKLKIPGFSGYLHPYDEMHVIGLGKEAVDSEGGGFAFYQGLKISLFDVSNVSAPVEVAKIDIGDRGTDSPALSDPHAFLFSKEKGLLVIPILEAKLPQQGKGVDVPSSAYGDYVYQGAYVFLITSNSITLRGRITHIQNDDLLKSGYWFSSDYSVYRSLYIGDNLYTISNMMMKINSLGDLSELRAISLS